MLVAFYIILGIYISIMFTWTAYLSVMSLMRIRDQLSVTTKFFAYPVAAVGVLADFLCNVVIGTVLFLEIPKDWLLTKRLDRHLEDTNFRGSIARWLCKNLLDPFDPKGQHCFKKTV